MIETDLQDNPNIARVALGLDDPSRARVAMGMELGWAYRSAAVPMDPEGGVPVPARVLAYAADAICLLPDEVVLCQTACFEATGEPDGDLCLEWSTPLRPGFEQSIASVSINGEGTAAWAATKEGTKAGCGTFEIANGWPECVLQAIRNIESESQKVYQ